VEGNLANFRQHLFRTAGVKRLDIRREATRVVTANVRAVKRKEKATYLAAILPAKVRRPSQTILTLKQSSTATGNTQ